MVGFSKAGLKLNVKRNINISSLALRDRTGNLILDRTVTVILTRV